MRFEPMTFVLLVMLVFVMLYASFQIGGYITQDNLLHTERFIVAEIDGEGVLMEPEGYGKGEGYYVTNEVLATYSVELKELDIVSVSWTQAQAEHSDWSTPARIQIYSEVH